MVLHVLHENIDLILLNNFTNALQNRCYIRIQWTCVLNSVVLTRQSNPPISQFISLWNEFSSVWSMILCNTDSHLSKHLFTWEQSVSISGSCTSTLFTVVWSASSAFLHVFAFWEMEYDHFCYCKSLFKFCYMWCCAYFDFLNLWFRLIIIPWHYRYFR